MENQNTGQNQENTEKEQNENQIIRTNAYFVVHEDGLNEIAQSLLLLSDYRNTWKIIRKRNMYYVLFNNNREYLKIWLDKKSDLLFYLGALNDNIFFESIEVGTDNTGCVIYTNNSIQCNEKVIEFKNIALFDIIRQIDYRLLNPVIWLICTKLY